MKQVIVIGGGIIGLSSAYYLHEAGFKVTVIDPHGGKVGASYGNAGFIGSSHYVPLSNPGAFQNALRWMLSPTSPFYIQPSLHPTLIRWGLLFMQHATATHVERLSKPLADIGLLSQRLFEELQAKIQCFDYEKKGLINMFQTEAALKKAASEVGHARSLGIDAVVVSREELAALEPNVSFKAIGGVHMRSDAHSYPPRVMAALLETVRGLGIEIIEERATALQHHKGHITAVECASKSNTKCYTADEFILANGIWSREIARDLGITLPMMAGRGYSITYPKAQLPLEHPLYLGEASVALTPMDGDKVRIGGTMEIVPLGTPPRINRVKGILNSANRFFPDVQFPEPSFDTAWYGYRPCSADGVPYIGRHRAYDNLIIGTGHAMLGFGLGPATGKLVTELALNEPTSIDLAPFSPDRFCYKRF